MNDFIDWKKRKKIPQSQEALDTRITSGEDTGAPETQTFVSKNGFTFFTID